MNGSLSNQELSNMAYEHVLRDLGLPRGTKLYKDEERVKLWQRYFALFQALEPMLREVTESEDPLLREAAE
jgi:hypothetical protein